MNFERKLRKDLNAKITIKKSNYKNCLSNSNGIRNHDHLLRNWLSALTYHSFNFNLGFLYELKHNLRLSKPMCGTFRFCSRKCIDFLTLKRHNS